MNLQRMLVLVLVAGVLPNSGCKRLKSVYDRGYAYYQKGEYDKAIADLTEAIRLDPECAEAYCCRGFAYNQKGESDKAIADLTEAIRLAEYAEAYCSRGFAYNQKGESDKAIADLTEAIRLDPEYAEAYCSRGFAYNAKSEFDKAIADFTEAIRFNPEHAEAYSGRGFAYNEKGEYDKASTNFTEATHLAPDDAFCQDALAWFLAYCPDTPYRDGKQAVAVATTACELTEWKDCNCIKTLAAAYAEAGDFQQAVKWQEKAVSMAPDNEMEDYRSRLDLYKSGKSYHETAKE